MDDLLNQLETLKAALTSASDEDKPALEQLISELSQLVTVSPSFGESSENSEPVCDQDYVQNETTQPESTPSLQEAFSCLEGMKCRAPHQVKWGHIGMYNAVIFAVEPPSCLEGQLSLDTINVRVVFTQPASLSMLPCTYFQEGRCRFEDAGCKFSHGEVVPLSQLKEYIEPDFTKVRPGKDVTAKGQDGLWGMATVLKLTENGECQVRYESKGEVKVIPLHDVAPLDSSDSDEEDSSDDSNNEDSDELDERAFVAFQYDSCKSNEALHNMTGSSALGAWENYTRGIGSKLMLKMGYVMGTGLGRNAEGRVEPVEAVILPIGRSLDACMEMKDKTGNTNLFKAEKVMKARQRKESKKASQLNSKIQECFSVFDFINSKLTGSSSSKNSQNGDSSHCLRKDVKSVPSHKESSAALNKKVLHIGDNIRQVTKEISKIQEAIRRQDVRDKVTADKLREKLRVKEQMLQDFQKAEANLLNVQKHKTDKKKLAIF